MHKQFLFLILNFLFINLSESSAQKIKLTEENFQPVQVISSIEKLNGIKVIKVIKDPAVKKVDEPTFVKIGNLNFESGFIEVKVLSRLLKDAPAFSRGFIGLAFRINESNSAFECIYIRPTNGRAGDQVRRNHSIQYYAYPDYKFDRLRKENPEKYESYSDMGLNEWITLRIEVSGSSAQLFLNDAMYPSLIVNDLKLSGNVSGAIGLWVDVGTEGYFRDLKIKKQKKM